MPHYNIQNIQFSTKSYKACKEKRIHGPSTGKKLNLLKVVPEEVQTLDLLEKDFKWNRFKKLKKTIPKELKVRMGRMSYQIENSKKKKKIKIIYLKEPNRNSRAEK